MRISLLLPALLFASALALNTAYAAEHGVTTTDSHNMEALLVESMLSISNNKLDVALNEVDSLLKINPNFKLAQLIRGDLLLARARPLNDFGNAPDAAARMADFRDEARAPFPGTIARHSDSKISVATRSAATPRHRGGYWQINALSV